MNPHRPNVMANRHMVVSGHYWASAAGFQILEAGGNAFDAGVAVGLATNVLESEMACFAGVAPAMLFLADQAKVMNFVGVGPWPRALSTEYFWKHHGGRVPPGILNTVVPAAPDIWLTVLERFGTMSFAEVASFAIRFAADGFPMYPFMVEVLAEHRAEFADIGTTAEIFLPDGELPPIGALFVQRDLAATLQHLADEETAAAHRGGRAAGFLAARRAFYEGDLAAAILAQQRDEGGLLTREDLAGYRAEIETPVRGSFGDWALYGCGPWSQGPMLLIAAQLLDRIDLASMKHNSAPYIHAVTEALKLAAADREAYFGDPAHINVPLAQLLSHEYAATRVGAFSASVAAPGMPPPGTLDGFRPPPWQPDPSGLGAPQPGSAATAIETSYFCVMDAAGNMFSATPSDPTISGSVVPGTGFTTSMWGSRAHTGRLHPARVGPGWRPRMSANPMLVMKPGEVIMPIGSPGSEVLGQAQLQVMLNLLVFGMDPQSAVEAPRFASASWPASAVPHTYHPGRLNVEAPIGEAVGLALSELGHRVNWWPERQWRAGSVCTIRADLQHGVMTAGADPRRTAYAIGW